MDMGKTTILVTGASGLLGRAIMQNLAQQSDIVRTGTAFSRVAGGLTSLDLRDFSAVTNTLDDLRPDMIVHCAAERRPDVSENDPEGTQHLNVDATRHLAQWCGRHGAWMLYMSTDYVFDDRAPPYEPDAPTHPMNAYGRSKLAGEQAVLKTTDNAAVLRVPILFGPCEDLNESAITNTISAMRQASGDKPLVLDHWATRYPTYTPDVAEVIRRMIQRHRAGQPMTGIFHGSGDEPFTKYSFARMAADMLGVDPDAIRPRETPTPGAPRPRDTRLDTARLTALGVGVRTPVATALRHVLTHCGLLGNGPSTRRI